MQEYSLKGGHGVCLYHLSHYPGGLTMKELTELSGEDKAAISRYIHYLRERGLVTKHQPEGSERKYRVPLMLTSEGFKIAEQVKSKVTAAVKYAEKDLTEVEKQVLYHALRSISDNIANQNKQ